jgi:acetyltransferase-like isoleucine patch superfamily enzyme
VALEIELTVGYSDSVGMGVSVRTMVWHQYVAALTSVLFILLLMQDHCELVHAALQRISAKKGSIEDVFPLHHFDFTQVAPDMPKFEFYGSELLSPSFAKRVKESCAPYLDSYPNCELGITEGAFKAAVLDSSKPRKRYIPTEYDHWFWLESANRIVDFTMQSMEDNLLNVSVGRMTYGIAVLKMLWHSERGTGLIIGRWCSIAEATIILGMNHCHKRATSSPLEVFLDAPTVTRETRKCYISYSNGPVTIGSDVWIGDAATIFSNVTIGHGAVIGAGAYVRKDVPPYAIVVGNPAEVVKYRHSPEQIAKLLDIRWWDWEISQVQEAVDDLTNDDVNVFIDKYWKGPGGTGGGDVDASKQDL